MTRISVTTRLLPQYRASWKIDIGLQSPLNDHCGRYKVANTACSHRNQNILRISFSSFTPKTAISIIEPLVSASFVRINPSLYCCCLWSDWPSTAFHSSSSVRINFRSAGSTTHFGLPSHGSDNRIPNWANYFRLSRLKYIPSECTDSG